MKRECIYYARVISKLFEWYTLLDTVIKHILKAVDNFYLGFNVDDRA